MKRFLLQLALIFLLSVHAGAERNINGVVVLTETDELVDPAHTAVVIIDLQNDWVSSEGRFNRADKSTPADPSRHKITPNYEQQIRNLKPFLARARKEGLPIVYAEYIHNDKNGVPLVCATDLWCQRNHPETPFQKDDEWQGRTVSDIAPQKGDLVIHKVHGDDFYGTPLDSLLKARGIKSVLMTGTATGACVLYSSLGALDHGYYPVFISDCVDPHFPDWFDHSFPMVGAEDVYAAWDRRRDESAKTKDAPAGAIRGQKKAAR
jgi:ureidoacrylate peracid hydrolase